MYTFHVTLFARPPAAETGRDVMINRQSLSPLALKSQELCVPLDVTFEETEAALSCLPRMFCEPDGSFVWRGHHNDTPWQVDGLLCDRDDRLLSLELKGGCPPDEFDKLLSAIGWPEIAVVFQLARQGVVLDEEEFRRWAAEAGRATD